MVTVELADIQKNYEGFQAVKGLSFTIQDGEFLILVGPSGCGKSTVLRMIAGLEEISGGDLRIGGVRINEVAPKDRDIAMVFQSYALYPHMSVADNIGFSLRLRGVKKDERKKKILLAAKALELEAHLEKKPSALSGGQRQRVAMGRAIVREPSLFLMDEPLSNLDAKLRMQMRSDIKNLQRKLGVTTVYVTHDQVEAMTMGDRVVVLKDGELQQIDTPRVLYDYPANLFVASFIGSPSMNLFEGFVFEDTLSSGDMQFKLSDVVMAKFAEGYFGGTEARKIYFGMRPEDLSMEEGDGARMTQLGIAEVIGSEFTGSELLVFLKSSMPKVDPGDSDSIDKIKGSADLILTTETDKQPAIGAQVPIFADGKKLHIFDFETQMTISKPS